MPSDAGMEETCRDGGLEVPENVLALYAGQEEIALVREYLDSLNEVQALAFCIARDHLQTSFNVVRSTGFVEWRKQRAKAAAAAAAAATSAQT